MRDPGPVLADSRAPVRRLPVLVSVRRSPARSSRPVRCNACSRLPGLWSPGVRPRLRPGPAFRQFRTAVIGPAPLSLLVLLSSLSSPRRAPGPLLVFTLPSSVCSEPSVVPRHPVSRLPDEHPQGDFVGRFRFMCRWATRSRRFVGRLLVSVLPSSQCLAWRPRSPVPG
jgi:hypothetical protein